MKKEKTLSKIISIIISIFVLVMIIISGPAEAFTLNLNSNKTSVLKGEKIIFTASVDINSNERLPVDKLILELTEVSGIENVSCEFNVNASIISGCKGIKIKRLNSSSFGYGYQQGEYSNYGYDFGYGYGYETGKLSYEITLSTENYIAGKYNTNLKTFIGENVFEKKGEDIFIVQEFGINVISPEEKNYNLEKIPIKVIVGQKAKKIEYIDFNDINSVWRKLCEECSEFGFDKEFIEKFKENKNSISIRAINYSGAIVKKDIVFFVDSNKPIIKRIEHVKDSFAKEDEFFIRYSEENLKNITLFYGKDKITKTNKQCPPGKLKECKFEVNLSKYNGQKIDYWFKVEDSVNFESSEKIKISVDTVSPVLKINSPVNTTYNSKLIKFSVSASENSTIEYINLLDKNPEWQKLCSGCNEYGVSSKKQKYFSEGKNSLMIRASDRAGNIDIKEVSFIVKV
ncbi:MAG: hypothetical protein AABX54_01855 [Nanoarchaeota archaeon]